VPFLIVNEGTKQRYLTGADFDIESMQFIGEHVWFGDELGPYLIKTDRKGKVLAIFDTKIDGKTVRSPDHFSVTTPATAGAFSTPVRRSRGYEGMAASKDGQYLYPLLEGPLWNEAEKNGRARRAASTCASSNSMWPRASGLAAPGSTRWNSTATTSATST